MIDRLGTVSGYRSDQHAYADLVEQHAGTIVDPVARAPDDPLFYIYTAGTTGAPKRIRHSTGGYLAQVA